jgi:hypothetical protein
VIFFIPQKFYFFAFLTHRIWFWSFPSVRVII